MLMLGWAIFAVVCFLAGPIGWGFFWVIAVMALIASTCRLAGVAIGSIIKAALKALWHGSCK